LLGIGTSIVLLAIAVALVIGVFIVVKFGRASPVADDYTMKLRKWFLAQIGLAFVLGYFVLAPNTWPSWLSWTAIPAFIIAYAYSLYRFPKRTPARKN
jgi:hypothetical protein